MQVCPLSIQGRRGTLMGIWNSHVYVGNIIGTLIAAEYVDDNWGELLLSFSGQSGVRFVGQSNFRQLKSGTRTLVR